MRIKQSCSSCFHNFSVSDELLGRRVKCPSCSEPVRVVDSSEGDDEEDVRPRRAAKSEQKSRKKSAANSNGGNHGLAIGLGVGGGVVALGLIVVALVMMQPKPAAPPVAAATTPVDAVPANPSLPAANTPPAATPSTTLTPAATPQPTPKTEIAQSPPSVSPPADRQPSPSTPAETNPPSEPAEPVAATSSVREEPESLELPKLQGVPSPSEQKLDLEDLIARVEPSVVRINVVTSEGASTGSGFVVSNDGTVVTNYHVITDAIKADVEFEGSSTKYKVLGYRHLVPKADIAIIKIDVPASKLKPVPLADKVPSKGTSVATFGAPLGLSFTTSEGVISAIRKEEDLGAEMGLDMIGTWLQTTAPISPGNSGGPLVDKYGRVVGINTMQLSTGQNLNFAVSAQEVIKALNAAPAKVKELKPEDLKHYERGLTRRIASEEYDTERGQRLFAEVKEIVLLSGASIQNFDPSGSIWDRVILRSQRAIEKSGIELSFGRPRPDVAILVVVLAMNPSKKGTDGTQELSVSAELTCVDPQAKKNESPLAKVWKMEQKIGFVSLKSAATGKVPQTVDDKLADFFGKFRGAYNKAVKATKDARK